MPALTQRADGFANIFPMPPADGAGRLDPRYVMPPGQRTDQGITLPGDFFRNARENVLDLPMIRDAINSLIPESRDWLATQANAFGPYSSGAGGQQVPTPATVEAGAAAAQDWMINQVGAFTPNFPDIDTSGAVTAGRDWAIDQVSAFTEPPRTSQAVPTTGLLASLIPQEWWDAIPTDGLPQGLREPDTGVRDDSLTEGQAVNFAANVLTGNYEEMLAKQAQLLELDIADIKAQYGGPMDQLQGVLDDLRAQDELSEAAYGRYSAAVAAIDPTVEQKGITGSDAPQEVARVYDDAQGALHNALANIDQSMGTEVAGAVTNEMRYMEGYIQDALRTDLSNVDALHAAAGQVAASVANLAYADNLYEAGKQQSMLEAQLAKAIDDQQEEIAAMRRQMDEAIARANQRSDLNTPDFDAQYQESYEDAMDKYYLDRYGLTGRDAAVLRDTMAKVASYDEAALLNEGNWAAAMAEFNNVWILTQVGLFDDVERWEALQADLLANAVGEGNEREATRIQNQLDAVNTWYRTADLGGVFANSGSAAEIAQKMKFSSTVATQMGIFDDAQFAAAAQIGVDNQGEWMAKGDDQWNQLRDAYTFQQAFDSEWAVIKRKAEEQATIVQEQYQTQVGGNTSGSHSTATNNYGNRYTDAYTYRRNEVAPYYASAVKAQFAGTEIGGLRYMRPPGDVGGGKIANSDHQSGGAIDVYNKGGSGSDTNRKLLRIANWFRGQPGVSYVTYEGQSAHQTGGSDAHVHVSFQVGWRVP